MCSWNWSYMRQYPNPRLICYSLPFPVSIDFVTVIIYTHRMGKHTCPMHKVRTEWDLGLNIWESLAKLLWLLSTRPTLHLVFSADLVSTSLKTFFLLKDLIHPETVSNHYPLITLQLGLSWALNLEVFHPIQGEKTMFPYAHMHTCVNQWLGDEEAEWCFLGTQRVPCSLPSWLFLSIKLQLKCQLPRKSIMTILLKEALAFWCESEVAQREKEHERNWGVRQLASTQDLRISWTRKDNGKRRREASSGL